MRTSIPRVFAPRLAAVTNVRPSDAPPCQRAAPARPTAAAALLVASVLSLPFALLAVAQSLL